NTNIWPYPNNNALGATYRYDTNIANYPNSGVAFDDAVLVLGYRYNQRWKNQATFQTYVNNDAASLNIFQHDFVDGYAHGPLMVGFHWPITTDADSGRVNLPWPGSDNFNHFFTTQELFDNNKVGRLADHLRLAGTNTLSSYD